MTLLGVDFIKSRSFNQLIKGTISSYHNAVAMINEMCELQKDILI